MRVAIVASGGSSSLGDGRDATRVTPLGERAITRVARDEELVLRAFVRPFVARARIETMSDRATALLDRALRECFAELDDAIPRWRDLRIGAAVGTSSGGMRKFEQQLEGDHRPPPAGTYSAPLADAFRPCAFEPVSLVLGACSSSTLALGIGRTWLLEDRCDIALCGGYDAVGVFVAAGFECLRATCTERGPQPFRIGRDGVALGEGAAIVALVRETQGPHVLVGTRPAARAWIVGFGASCDAAHLTAPDLEGAGLSRAGRLALDDAGAPPVALVSAHGTATKHNDASEALAITRLVGADVPVFGFKGTIGHPLGAAGVLETLASIEALERGIAPASYGEGPFEPSLRMLDRSEPLKGDHVLKLSSAFGGSNAALVVTTRAHEPSPLAKSDPVRVSHAVVVGRGDADPARLAETTGYSTDRIVRADDLVRLAMAAVAKLQTAQGPLTGAGIVVGLGLATLETNTLFLARLNGHGPTRAEPRRFPFTTPNAAAGECAVVFGLTGPAFAVGGGPHGGIEALMVGRDLVQSGVVDRVVVVAADHAGEATARLAPETTSGAVAMLVARAGLDGTLAEATVRYDADGRVPQRLPAMDAHRALLPFTGTRSETAAVLPWGGQARAHVVWSR
jgi:3-oxoacyl-[acyl-carrier-protein] synthase II